MKIKDVTCFPLAMPLDEPLRWGLFEVSSRGAVIVRVETECGLVGHGEAGYSVHAYNVVAPIVRDALRPLLVGQDPFNVERLWQEMFRRTHKWGRRGVETYALSGVDIALWDIIGQACGLPLYKIFGACREEAPVYWAPSLKPSDLVRAETADAARRGFKAIKLRVGLDLDQDLAIVRAAREAGGDDMLIAVDANMAYDFRTAVKMACRFAEFGISWLEEPIETHSLEQYVDALARLKRESPIPIAGGESLFTRYEFVPLLERRAVDIVQPDCAGVGGITECRKIAAMASALDLMLVPHIACSSFTAFGFAANLHIVGSTYLARYVEYDAYDNPMRRELVSPPFEAKKGMIAMPSRPGLGVTLQDSELRRFMVAAETR